MKTIYVPLILPNHDLYSSVTYTKNAHIETEMHLLHQTLYHPVYTHPDVSLALRSLLIIKYPGLSRN